MKYIAGCSGGKDSVATLILAKEKNEPIDEVYYCEVMFDSHISGEHPEHRDFIYNKLKPWVENELHVPFVVLRSEKTFVGCFYHVYTRGANEGMRRGFLFPSRCVVQRDCKLPPVRKYMKQIEGETVRYIGIAADETKRLARLDGTGQVSLLAKYNVTEEMAKDMCEKAGLLSPIYQYTKRNGCWFCPNCKDKEWERLIDTRPDLFERLVEMEKAPNVQRRLLTRQETPSELRWRLIENY